MFLKKIQVDIKNFLHEGIMAMVSQELVLKTHDKSLVSETCQTSLTRFIQPPASRVTFSRYSDNL